MHWATGRRCDPTGGAAIDCMRDCLALPAAGKRAAGRQPPHQQRQKEKGKTINPSPNLQLYRVIAPIVRPKTFRATQALCRRTPNVVQMGVC